MRISLHDMRISSRISLHIILKTQNIDVRISYWKHRTLTDNSELKQSKYRISLLNRTVPNVFQKRNRVEPHRTLQPVPRESHHHATKIHNKPTPQSHHLRYNVPVYLRLFTICFAREINHNIRYTKIMCKIRNLLTDRATEVSQE